MEMIARLNHPAARQHVCDREPSGDPTGTTHFRLRYRAMIDARWRQLSNAMRKVIIDQDFFGIQSLPTKGVALTVSVLVPREQRVGAFKTWLDQVVDRIVMANGAEYLKPMIAVPYAEGVVRAKLQTKSDADPMSRTTGSDLHQLAVSELRGIADTVSQHLTRRAADGLNIGLDAVQLWQHLDQGILTYGEQRSHTMVNLLVVKAFNLGTLDQYEAAGVARVISIPETARAFVTDAPRKQWYKGPGSRIKKGATPSARTMARIRAAQKRIERLGRVDILTAGDDKVCPVCEDIAENGPYTVNEARSLIPAHPNCRCAFIPADDARFAGDKFDPNQPRDPKGTPTGGQWSSTEASLREAAAESGMDKMSDAW